MRLPRYPSSGRWRTRRLVRRSRLLDLAAALGLILLLALAGAEVQRRFAPSERIVGPAEAIDGDSLSVSGRVVRLKGVDAPEYRQSCENAAGRSYPCGAEARRWLESRLRRGIATCDIAAKDRYGRPLAICSVADENLNAAIVRSGHAVDYGGYAEEEQQARRAKVGLWAGRFMPPSEWRASHSRDGAPSRAN